MNTGHGRVSATLIMAVAALVIACAGGGNAVPPPTPSPPIPHHAKAPELRGVVVEAFYIPVCTTRPGSTPPGCERVDLDGVEVTVRHDADVVAQQTTGADGRVRVDVLAGDYTVEGRPDPRARITPPPQRVLVADSGSVVVSLQYATPSQ